MYTEEDCPDQGMKTIEKKIQGRVKARRLLEGSSTEPPGTLSSLKFCQQKNNTFSETEKVWIAVEVIIILKDFK